MISLLAERLERLFTTELMAHVLSTNNRVAVAIDHRRLRPYQEPLSGFMISRYVHSIRDTNTKQFIHLDGAVRLYPADTYETRFHTKIHQAPKAENSKEPSELSSSRLSCQRVRINAVWWR